MSSEDYPWLAALTAPRSLTANATRLAQEGVSTGDAERGVAVIERSLSAEGPLTLGWVSREPVLGAHAAQLITVNGLFRPFALVAGRARATWSLHHGSVELAAFDEISPADSAALKADAADVARYLGISSQS